MKKLTKSMKIVLISVVSAVCVAGIVLGCVFGFRKNGGDGPLSPYNPEPDGPVTPVEKVLTWDEQVQLLSEQVIEKQNSLNAYSLIDGVPFGEYVEEDETLYSISPKYFVVEHDSEGAYFKKVYYFSKNANGEFEVTLLNTTKENGGIFENDSLYTNDYVIGDDDYVIFKSHYDEFERFTIFDVQKCEVTKTIDIANQEAFGVIATFSTNHRLLNLFVEGETKSYAVALDLKTGKYYLTPEYDTNPEITFEVYDNFLVRKDGQTFDIYSVGENELLTATITLQENEKFETLFQTSETKLLFEYSKKVSSKTEKSVVVENDNGTNNFVEYFYKVAKLSKVEDTKQLSVENYNAGEFAKVENEKVVNSDDFYKLNFYKVNADSILVLDSSKVVYRTGAKVLEYAGGEEILHISNKNVLTKEKLFTISETEANVLVKAFDEKGNLALWNNYEDKFMSGTTSEENADEHTIQVYDMNGTLLLEDAEIADFFNDDTNMIYPITLARDNIFVKKDDVYSRLSYETLKLEEVGNFNRKDRVLEQLYVYEVYFLKLEEGYKVCDFNGNDLFNGKEVASFEYVNSNRTTLVVLTMKDGTKNYIRTDGVKFDLDMVEYDEMNGYSETHANSRVADITAYGGDYYKTATHYKNDGGSSTSSASIHIWWESPWGWGWAKTWYSEFTFKSSSTFYRTGYTFSNWSMDGSTYSASSNYKTTGEIGDKSVYANWSENSYTLYFNANTPSDASHTASVDPTEITVKYTEEFTTPTPKLTGWTAKGWTYSSTATYVSFNCGTTISKWLGSGSATYYAKYNKNSYTIQYSNSKTLSSILASGSITGTVSSTTAYYDSNVTLSSSYYSLTGWTQLGWSTSYFATTATYTKGQTLTKPNFKTSGTKTLYAVWRKNNYTINLDANGGTISDGAAISGVTKNSNTQFTTTYDTTGKFTNTIVRTGYMFAGWTRSSGTGTASSTPSNTSYSNLSSYYDANTNTSSGIGITTTTLNLTATDNGSVTLTAQWTPITYYVQLSNSYSTGSTAPSLTYPSDTAVSGLTFSNPVYTLTYGTAGKFKISTNRRGYVFNGWNNSGTSYTGTSNTDTNTATSFTTTATNLTYTYKGTVTLTEQWTAIKYTISLNANSGTISSGTANSGITKKSHTSFEATYDSTGVFTNDIVRAGYMFDGWDNLSVYSGSTVGSLSSKPSGTGTSNASFTAYYNTAANKNTATKIAAETTALNNCYTSGGSIEFKARWIPITYNLVYSARKPASGLYGVDATNNPTGTTANSTATYDANSTFSANAYSLFGWTYTGWTNENSTTAKWASGYTTTSPLNLSTTKDANVSIYATWRQNSYSITYKINGGSNTKSGGNYPSIAYFDSPFSVSIPVRTGYTFTKYSIYTFTTNNQKFHGNTSSLGTTLNADVTTLEVAAANADGHYYKNLCSADGGSITFETTWTANKYNIVYNYNDTSGTTRAVDGANKPSQMTYDIWANISNPSRLGYTFTGWTISGMSNTCTHYYGTGTGSGQYTSTTATGVTVSNVNQIYFLNLHSETNANVTFKANWSANTYYVVYDYNDNETGHTTEVKDDSKVTTGTLSAGTYSGKKYLAVAFDSWANITNPVRVGYTFTGWSVTNMSNTCTHDYGKSSSSFSSTTSTLLSLSDTTITYFRNLHNVIANASSNVGLVNFKANWSANTYKIAYVVGSTGGGLGEGTFPSSATFDVSFYVDEPTVYPFGYHFGGWLISGASSDCTHYYGNTSSLGSTFTGATKTVPVGTHYYKSLTSVKNNTVTFTAVWTPNRYNLSYVLQDLKGGNGHFTGSYPTYADYDITAVIPFPVRTGYTFMGWSLSSLSDDCTHYYGSPETAFESTNGDYLEPDNPNAFRVLKVNNFKNLHCDIGATVVLTANWKANTYQITYHYMPSSTNVSSIDESNINTISHMTGTKTQSVIYDAYFTTFRMSASDSDPNGVSVPRDLKILYWIFYATEQSGSTRTGTYVNSDIVPTHSRTLLPGTEYIYNSNNFWGESYYSLFGANVHAYAVYGMTDITVRLFYAPNKVNTNFFSNYVEGTTYYTKTYKGFTYPSSVPNLGGRTLLGYWISSNYYISGEITRESVSSYVVNGTTYRADAGQNRPWGYPSTLSMDPETPTFYMYAVYDDRVQSLYDITYSSNMITIDTRNIFTVGKTYKLTVRGFESTSNNDYKYLFFGGKGSSPASEWGTINSHTTTTKTKYEAKAENSTTMTITFTATSSDNGYYLNLYFNKYDTSSYGGSISLATILADMDIQINEVVNKDAT